MKRNLLIGLTVAAISTVAVAGAALAHGGGIPGIRGGSGDTYLDKLATELGVERSKLDDAISKAQSQVASEQLDAYLAAAVTAGRITQVQSDEIEAWVNARPAVADKVMGSGLSLKAFAHGFGRGHGRGHYRGFGPGLNGTIPAEALDAHLASLVTNGVLTQAEADSIKAWVNARPTSLDNLLPFRYKPATLATPVPQQSGTSTAAAALNA